ncbi:MAG: hypothetical protein JOZ98_05615 [Solirubrobacterales bacterium]|nr:hypothetical protein [Solirubrobacterales bacterium]
MARISCNVSVSSRFSPFLGSDLRLGSNLNPNITGNRTYTRAHFLYYDGCRRVGGVRPTRPRVRAP